MDSVVKLASAFSGSLTLSRRRKRWASASDVEDSRKGTTEGVVSISDYLRDRRNGNIFFLADSAGSDGRTEWIRAADAISSWPLSVLDYYMSDLTFGSGDGDQCPDYCRPTGAIEGLRNCYSEEEELRLLEKLLKVGADRLSSGEFPCCVNGLIRYTHNGSILAFVVFDGKGSAEALLPLQVCRRMAPKELLDFLHVSVHLGEEGDDVKMEE